MPINPFLNEKIVLSPIEIRPNQVPVPVARTASEFIEVRQRMRISGQTARNGSEDRHETKQASP